MDQRSNIVQDTISHELLPKLPFRTKAEEDLENTATVSLPSPRSAQSEHTKMKDTDPAAGKSVKTHADSASSHGTLQNLPSKTPSGALPDFILRRNKLFEELKRQHDREIIEKEHSIINVMLDLGLDKDGKPRTMMPVAAKAWESTPGSFLKHVDKDISSDVVIAKVDGKELWDLDRPLERDCCVSYVPFASAEGRNVFWHSSAHVLGEAAECQFQCLLSHGPPVEQGFFYDMAIADG